VRRGKSASGGTVGGSSVARGGARDAVALLRPCLGDLQAAARAEGPLLEARPDLAPGAFEVVELVLAEKQSRAEA
jgi:hypothetical protein